MPQFKQIKAEPAVNSGTKGSFCRYERMQALFVASPLYNDYKDDAIEKLGHQKLFVEDVNDAGHSFGVQSRNYVSNGVPDYEEVETGGGGLPASAHAPNTASPLEGVNRPDTIPEAPDGYGSIESADNWGVGAGAKLSPLKSAAQISYAGRPLGFYGLPANRSSEE